MPTPPRARRVGQINFGLSQGRSSINAVASLSSPLRMFRPSSLCSRSVDQRLTREKSYLAIIVIYVFITDRYFDATRLRCFQLSARNIFPPRCRRFVSNFGAFFDSAHYCATFRSSVIPRIAIAIHNYEIILRLSTIFLHFIFPNHREP